MNDPVAEFEPAAKPEPPTRTPSPAPAGDKLDMFGNPQFDAKAGENDTSGAPASRTSALDQGERSSFALLPVAIASLELLLEWRVERVARPPAPLSSSA